MSVLPIPEANIPMLPPRRAQRPIEHPLLAYLGSLSPRSHLTVQERLRAVARMMRVPYEQVEWHELRAHHVERVRQALSERGVAPSTVNGTLPALKGIARRAESEPYDLGGVRPHPRRHHARWTAATRLRALPASSCHASSKWVKLMSLR